MRLLKILGIALGSLVAAIIVLVIIVHLVVNPNDFKPRIIQAVKASTGRDLALPGDIKLSVFPWLAVQLGPASLGNPPGFGAGPFASLQRASLRVRLFPLLRHQLEIGRVEIDGLDLNLRKNSAGVGNWQMSTKQQPSASAGTSSVPVRELAGVTIKNSRIDYQGLVADHVDVSIGRFAPGAPVPMKWSLDLTPSAGARPIPVSGSAVFAYGDNAARVSSLDARLDESTLRGSAAVTNLSTRAMTFDLSIDRIDLDRYLAPSAKAAPPARARAASASASPPIELPTDSIRPLRVNGTLAIGSATVRGIKLTQMSAHLAANDGLVRLAPVKAQLYGGNYSGDVTLDARGAVPALRLGQSLTGVDVEQLLADYAHVKRLSGRGNVTTDLTAHGKDSDALLRTLSGHVAANLANGAIEGMDLWYELDRAAALVQHRAQPSAQGSGQTRFDTFKASADLASGVASTHDLDIASQSLRLTGQGTANLVTGAVNYRVKAMVLRSAAPGAASAPALADIPLVITGTMTSPSVRPDVEAATKSLVQEQLQKHKGELQQKLQDKLKGLFGR